MTRADREDLTTQHNAVQDARQSLSARLKDLSIEADQASRAVTRGKRPSPNMLDRLIGRYQDVRNAEEALDLALLDLDTAAGGDA